MLWVCKHFQYRPHLNFMLIWLLYLFFPLSCFPFPTTCHQKNNHPPPSNHFEKDDGKSLHYVYWKFKYQWRENNGIQMWSSPKWACPVLAGFCLARLSDELDLFSYIRPLLLLVSMRSARGELNKGDDFRARKKNTVTELEEQGLEWKASMKRK